MIDIAYSTESGDANLPAPPGPLLELVVGPKQLAQLLRISPRELQRLRNRGLVPAPDLSVSRRIQRWSLDNVRAWLGAGCPTEEIWRLHRGQHRKAGAR